MLNRLAPDMNEMQRHAAHIKRQEYEAARTLLNGVGHVKGKVSVRSLGDFAVEAYSRVADMFARPDFESCDRFVMVGCGPLPVTLLHVADKYPDIDILGLDIDPASIDIARQVIDVFGLRGVTLLHDDGAACDFSRAGIVYVANLVFPKSAVLKQISRTGRPGTLVVLRDPTPRGKHLADVGLDAVDHTYRIEGMGSDNRMFASRHIFLRLCAGNHAETVA